MGTGDRVLPRRQRSCASLAVTVAWLETRYGPDGPGRPLSPDS